MILIKKYGDKVPIYAQLIRNEEQQFFSISACCGLDIEGRIVHLTYLEISGLTEEPMFKGPTEELPEESSRCAINIKQRIEHTKDRWVCGIEKMLRVAGKKKYIKSLANVEIRRAHYPPDWTPQKVRRRRIQFILSLGVAAVIIAVLWFLLSGYSQYREYRD